MIRVTHVITGMGFGGAEMMLAKLVTGMGSEFQSRVISLNSEGSLADRIRESGIDVTSLDLRPSFIGAPGAAKRIADELRRWNSDLVQSWLYHADLLGGMAATLARRPVIWNIQSSTLEAPGIRRRTLGIVRACSLASHFMPRAIVSCSQTGMDVHVRMGYSRRKFRVIPNGVDVSIFRPDPEARATVRRELGVTDDLRLIGMVARLHPQKDHANFLAAAGQLIATHPNVRFVLVGLGLDRGNDEMMAMIRAMGVERQTILLGLCDDIQRLLPALDVHTLSSSFGEGFPNVVGEAMAAGVPCVVTDVGDSPLIVGDTGACVPSRDSTALAGAWRKLLDLSPAEFAELRARARNRVAEHFSLQASVAQYEALYAEAVQSS